MKSLQQFAPTQHLALTDDQIVKVCTEAANAEVDYAFKAMVAGQMLIEKRHEMQMTSHGGKSWTDRTKPEDSQFSVWLTKLGIPTSTAYRWMDCAERVMRSRLGLSMTDDFQPFIEVEGRVIPHSHLLTADEADLPAEASALRQAVFDFMQDKSLGEAARAAFGGDSESHRITRAANGRKTGGTNDRDDRKAFHQFVGVKLANLNTHMAHWKKMTPLQRQEITAAFVALCAGDEFKPSYSKTPIKFGLLPTELAEAMAEALRLRLKNAKGARL